jgi:hypothetical protein
MAHYRKIQLMFRAILVIFVLFTVIESPTAVLRCRLLAQEDHVTDPCLFDEPIHSLNTHTNHLTPSYMLDTIHSDIYGAISLLGRAGYGLIYAIKAITDLIQS